MWQIPGSEFNWIFNLIFIVMFMFIYLYGQRLQTYLWTKQAESGLSQIEVLAKQGRQLAHKALKDIDVEEQAIKPTLDDFLDYFVIEPVDRDLAAREENKEHLLCHAIANAIARNHSDDQGIFRSRSGVC